jgi:hypothetical protein
MAFGMQVFPASGSVLRMDTTDRVVRFAGYYSGTLSKGGSVNVSIPGLDISGGQWGIALRTSQYLEYQATSGNVFVEYTNAVSSSPATINYRIYVFRI